MFVVRFVFLSYGFRHAMKAVLQSERANDHDKEQREKERLKKRQTDTRIQAEFNDWWFVGR